MKKLLYLFMAVLMSTMMISCEPGNADEDEEEETNDYGYLHKFENHDQDELIFG